VTDFGRVDERATSLCRLGRYAYCDKETTVLRQPHSALPPAAVAFIWRQRLAIGAANDKVIRSWSACGRRPQSR
jgi:hypothetical protein